MNRFYKGILLVFLVSLFFTRNVYAWERHSDTTLLLGFRGGINLSRTSIGGISTGSLMTKNYNFILSLHFMQEITFHSGFGFHQKGFVINKAYTDIYNNPIGNHPTYERFSYFNIPITLQYNLGRKKFNVYLCGGLDFNFLISQLSTADLPEFYNNNRVEPFEESLKDNFVSLGIGYHAGIGMEYKIFPALQVFADARFYNDFINNYKYISLPELKHRYYSISLGMRIGIPIKFNV